MILSDEPIKRRHRLAVWRLVESYGAQRVAEVGVYKGHCAIGLFQAPSTSYVLLVDPWAESCAEGSITHEMSQQEWEEVFESVSKKARLWGRAFDTKHEILRMPSAMAVQHVPNRSLDLVHIDADHRYEGVKQDILLWQRKVREGGCLCGDDYDKESVQRAVDNLLPGVNILEGRVWEQTC